MLWRIWLWKLTVESYINAAVEFSPEDNIYEQAHSSYIMFVECVNDSMS
jgi:hypothetical protein